MVVEEGNSWKMREEGMMLMMNSSLWLEQEEEEGLQMTSSHQLCPHLRYSAIHLFINQSWNGYINKKAVFYEILTKFCATMRFKYQFLNLLTSLIIFFFFFTGSASFLDDSDWKKKIDQSILPDYRIPDRDSYHAFSVAYQKSPPIPFSESNDIGYLSYRSLPHPQSTVPRPSFSSSQHS